MSVVADTEGHQTSQAIPSLRAMFLGFFLMGMCGFGGVLPWARLMIVEQRGWLTPAEFTDLLALCQFLPGPNITNMSIVLGARFRGPAGAATCLLGLMAAPVAIVLALGTIYDRFADVPAVERAFEGLAAAASGLILVMAIKIAAPLRNNVLGIAIAVVAFVAIALLRLPLLPVLVVLAPVSVVLFTMLGPRRRGTT
jgi:chromate transporter